MSVAVIDRRGRVAGPGRPPGGWPPTGTRWRSPTSGTGRLEVTRAAVEAEGGQARAWPVDLRDAAAIAGFFAAVAAGPGPAASWPPTWPPRGPPRR